MKVVGTTELKSNLSKTLCITAVLIQLPFCANASEGISNFNQPLNRPYTLRNSTPFILEGEYDRMIRGSDRRSYLFPRPCLSELDSSSVCVMDTGWAHADTENAFLLNINPVAGFEYRYLKENVESFDGGLVVSGYKGPLSYYLDARMFVELHEDYQHASYDREFVERQDEKASGSINYTSYSRYRSNLSYDMNWCRLSAARDAVHWGPGLYSNLTFHQNGVPFNHLVFTSSIGPLTVMSLYGQLAINTNSKSFRASADDRSVYAHRYEWSVTRNLLLGISEQLILFDDEEPFAFIPVVPLYIAKGTGVERLNNGNIAFDASYRFPHLGTVYSEFLIDDLQAPTSLFDHFWGNKWGWLAGTHLAGEIMNMNTGLILEYCRIEPWVYTHYDSNSAQSAHLGFPLGNQLGPNSQSATAKMHMKNDGRWYASLMLEAIWKGTDPGSHLNDGIDDYPELQRKPKVFLNGVSSPDFYLTPYAFYHWKWLVFETHIRIGSDISSILRMQFQY